MKKASVAVVVLAVAGTFVWATDSKTDAGIGSGKSRPCLSIVKACKAAGYSKGQWLQGKGLFMNCFGPVVSGQSVQGANVDASDIQACKQKIIERQAARAKENR